MSQSKSIVSREEYQVKKLMEGLSKGKAAGGEPEKEEKDASKETNQHMPKYIAQAPWYLNQKEEGLAHQKAHGGKTTIGINEWYQRGVKQPAAYKYRKGACENCGAMTHKTKDCCERPRKLGAKWTGKDIQGDELIQNFEMNYAAKRDSWAGYDPEMYDEKIQEYEQFEEARKQMRHNELEKAHQPNEDAHIDDEFKERIFDDSGTASNPTDPKIKTNIRNLRIREDIAKYLINLDENSAYYDAKTHSMRENPTADAGDTQVFKGDNFSRNTGDTTKLMEQEKFVLDLMKKEGVEIELNSVALPTVTEMVYRKAKEVMTKQAEERKRQLADKYGEKKEGDPDYNVIFGQSETYVEYLPDGKVKPTKNTKAQAGKSRYEEDMFPNDHTAVWGSWWNPELGWGFACCWQTDRLGMCLGEKGKKLALVKEFKIKKAKQEELAAFTKEVVGHDASPDHQPEEEAPLQEKAILIEKPVESAEPVQQVKSPVKEEKPVVAPVTAKVEEKKPEKKHLESLKQNKPARKRIESSDSSASSGTSSSDSSDSDSDSGSDSDSSKSSVSSRSSGRRRGKPSRLTEKQEKRQRDKNRKSGGDDGERHLKKAVQKQEGKVRDGHKSLNEKRKYNSVKGDNNDVTAEEIEAYKLSKKRFDDPMHFA